MCITMPALLHYPTPQAAAGFGSLAVAAPVFAESKDSLTLAGKGGMTGTRAMYQDVRRQPSAPATTCPPPRPDVWSWLSVALCIVFVP